MDGVTDGIIGVCVSLPGIPLATCNLFAIGGTLLGLILSIAGFFIKDE